MLSTIRFRTPIGKTINYLSIMVCLLGFVLVTQSCNKDDEEPVLTNQERLQTETPLQIVNSGVSIDELYGLTYEGGLIFYLNTTDGTGLVAATGNQSDNADWGCSGTDIPGLDNVSDLPSNPETAVGARVGDGKDNTAAIVAACTEAGFAAKLCDNLVINGKDDWFLPSRGEMFLIFSNLHVKAGIDFDTGQFYCSSTEDDSDHVWVSGGNSGSFVSVDKLFPGGFSVRAVRAF